MAFSFEGIPEPSLYVIKGIAILDNDGNRIFAKYYDPNILATVKEQKAFEKNLFNKTHRSNDEIIMLDGLTCLYRSNVDLFFYVMGLSSENELILLSILQCLYESLSQILRKNVEKRVVLDNLDIVMLAIDEICDGGVILEADPGCVVQKVALRTDDIPIGEQTVAQTSKEKNLKVKLSPIPRIEGVLDWRSFESTKCCEESITKDAATFEFVLHIREKIKEFEDLVATAIFPTTDMEYERQIRSAFPEASPQKLRKGIHYRKIVLLLHFGNVHDAPQLERL